MVKSVSLVGTNVMVVDRTVQMDQMKKTVKITHFVAKDLGTMMGPYHVFHIG